MIGLLEFGRDTRHPRNPYFARYGLRIGILINFSQDPCLTTMKSSQSSLFTDGLNSRHSDEDCRKYYLRIEMSHFHHTSFMSITNRI